MERPEFYSAEPVASLSFTHRRFPSRAHVVFRFLRKPRTTIPMAAVGASCCSPPESLPRIHHQTKPAPGQRTSGLAFRRITFPALSRKKIPVGLLAKRRGLFGKRYACPRRKFRQRSPTLLFFRSPRSSTLAGWPWRRKQRFLRIEILVKRVHSFVPKATEKMRPAESVILLSTCPRKRKENEGARFRPGIIKTFTSNESSFPGRAPSRSARMQPKNCLRLVPQQFGSTGVVQARGGPNRFLKGTPCRYRPALSHEFANCRTAAFIQTFLQISKSRPT